MPTDQFKATCPHCQGEMSAEWQYLGKEAPCPHCGKPVALLPPPPPPTQERQAPPSGNRPAENQVTEQQQLINSLHHVHRELTKQTAELQIIRVRTDKIHYWVLWLGLIAILSVLVGGCAAFVAVSNG